MYTAQKCIFITILNRYRLIGLVGRVFANGPGDLVSKTLKMVLDTSLLNTQQYKVCIKGKVEQSRERSSVPLHLGVVAIEKGAFWLPLTTVANNNLVVISIAVHPFVCRRMFLQDKKWICLY